MALIPETANLWLDDVSYAVPASPTLVRPITAEPYEADGIVPVSPLVVDTAFGRDFVPMARPTWLNYSEPTYLPQYPDQDLEIRGTVLDEDSNPIERPVFVLSRNGALLGRTISAADGTFAVLCRNYGAERVIVIAAPYNDDLRNAQVVWGPVPVPRA